MDRSFSNQLDVPDDHAAIREGVRAVVSRFDDEYWLARDEDGEFPRAFHRAMADAGWLGITMPDAGLNTTRIKTFAEKVPGGYLVHGQKVWTSTAQIANKIMLLTRTTSYEDCARPTDG